MWSSHDSNKVEIGKAQIHNASGDREISNSPLAPGAINFIEEYGID
jgi:hypothetical protein